MLNSFCIKTNNRQVINYLQSEFECCNLDNLYFSLNQFKNYSNIILHYKGKNEIIFYSVIARILTRTVCFCYEEHLLKNILLSNYFYFSEVERKEILKKCEDIINDVAEAKTHRDNLIFSAFFEYVAKNKYLIIDGFINFRLERYIKELDEIVDLAVDKYVIEREYNEFIDLLRNYVSSKESGSTIIHLIYHEEETILLDDNKHIIDISSEIFDGKYLSDISFSSNDYALNALLNLLPEKIFVHVSYEECDEFINTIKQIFENRVNICTSCPICNLYRIQNNNINKLT